MPEPRRHRVAWTVATVALVLLVVGAGTSAFAVIRGAQSGTDYRTATVSTGDVEQSVSLPGTVLRLNQVTASFPTTGTVLSVAVTLGEKVTAGQRLATMEPAALRASVLSAQASLAQAEAQLATDESGSSASGSASSAAGSAAAPAAVASRSATSRSASGSGAGGASRALAGADAALRAVNRALDAENSVCGPVLDPGDTGAGAPASTPASGRSLTPSPSPSPTPTESGAPATTPTPEPSITPTPEPSITPTPEPSVTPTPTPTPAPSATPTPQPTPTGTSGGSTATPTPAEIRACMDALRKTASALQQTRGAIQSIVTSLTQAGSTASRTTTSSGSGAASTTSTGRSSSGSAGGSTASRIAADEVTILQGQNAVAQTQSDLDATTLTAPIAGVVGEIDLVARQTASTANGIVIVGDGAASVTVDVPLADVPVLHAGQTAKVTPLGGVDAVDGVIQAVDLLPSSSSGSSPTYPATVLVADPTAALASGSSATVDIAVGSAKGVLRVPASAMSGHTGDAGTVTVMSGGTPTRAAVTLGVVGGGWAQIMSGLDAGQRVVIADASQALPTNTTRGLGGGGGFFRRQTTSTGTTQGSGAGG